MDKLIINRERWLRGNDPAEDGMSWLVSPRTDKMSCLGFLGKQCGFTEMEMRGVTSPGGMELRRESWPNQLVDWEGNITNLAVKLMGANDRHSISEQEREAELIFLFAKLGIELEFTSEVQNG